LPEFPLKIYPFHYFGGLMSYGPDLADQFRGRLRRSHPQGREAWRSAGFRLQIAPGLQRAAIMFNPDTAPASVYMPSLETAARSFKVEPIIAPVHSDGEIETAIIALGREPGGGLVVMPDTWTNAHRASIISAAAGNDVPAVYELSTFPRDGGLLSYGVDRVDIWRRTTSYVDRILRGAKPDELPVQFPTKFEMVVNLKTAKALGLTVPPSILLRADEQIE
jgi:putative ABC transport system substrate-binding protein